jgi:hypothetical protein
VRCQSCGKEIADKAIVCYRCGEPTAIPERPTAAATGTTPRAGLGGVWLWLIWVALVGGGGAFAALSWDLSRPIQGVLVAFGVISGALIWRLTRR